MKDKHRELVFKGEQAGTLNTLQGRVGDDALQIQADSAGFKLVTRLWRPGDNARAISRVSKRDGPTRGPATQERCDCHATVPFL